jgi:hypothetical protein
MKQSLFDDDKTVIFVFGSNLAGRHGRGSALEAVKNWGAVYGNGVGLQGRSYAIPTKDEYLKVLPLEEISKYVREFVEFARSNQNMEFYVVKIGCGLSGYRDSDIQPMFEIEKPLPCNIVLPKGW